MSFFEALIYFMSAVIGIVLIVLLANRKKIPGISTDDDVINLIIAGDTLLKRLEHIVNCMAPGSKKQSNL